jgi:hypothetical protein
LDVNEDERGDETEEEEEDGGDTRGSNIHAKPTTQLTKALR